MPAVFREAASGETVRTVDEALGAAVARLRSGRPLEDDVTFLVVRVTGPVEAEVTRGAKEPSVGASSELCVSRRV